jgi:hypothetical protein
MVEIWQVLDAPHIGAQLPEERPCQVVNGELPGEGAVGAEAFSPTKSPRDGLAPVARGQVGAGLARPDSKIAPRQVKKLLVEASGALGAIATALLSGLLAFIASPRAAAGSRHRGGRKAEERERAC